MSMWLLSHCWTGQGGKKNTKIELFVLKEDLEEAVAVVGSECNEGVNMCFTRRKGEH